jgi:FkbM family methyltransferase
MTDEIKSSTFDRLPRASFHALIERVKNSTENPFVLQIGAMDGVFFDLLHSHLMQGGWRGVLVEPLPDMFASLQKAYAGHPEIKLVNCAVSDHKGALTFHRIDPEAVAKGLLPKEALGMTTSYSDRGFPARADYKERFEAHVLDVQTPCKPLQDILDEQHVEKIDVVVIDAEGADWMIAKQIDFVRYNPRLILLEFSSLKPNEITDCSLFMSKQRYGLGLCQEDMENLIFYKDPEKPRQ